MGAQSHALANMGIVLGNGAQYWTGTGMRAVPDYIKSTTLLTPADPETLQQTTGSFIAFGPTAKDNYSGLYWTATETDRTMLYPESGAQSMYRAGDTLVSIGDSIWTRNDTNRRNPYSPYGGNPMTHFSAWNRVASETDGTVTVGDTRHTGELAISTDMGGPKYNVILTTRSAANSSYVKAAEDTVLNLPASSGTLALTDDVDIGIARNSTWTKAIDVSDHGRYGIYETSMPTLRGSEWSLDIGHRMTLYIERRRLGLTSFDLLVEGASKCSSSYTVTASYIWSTETGEYVPGPASPSSDKYMLSMYTLPGERTTLGCDTLYGSAEDATAAKYEPLTGRMCKVCSFDTVLPGALTGDIRYQYIETDLVLSATNDVGKSVKYIAKLKYTIGPGADQNDHQWISVAVSDVT